MIAVETIIILLLTKDMIVSGYNNSCSGTNVPGHKRVCAQSCLGTNLSGHKRIWAQTCLCTIVSGHNLVWAQICLGTNVCGHKRVWAQMCVGTIMYVHKRGGTLVENTYDSIFWKINYWDNCIIDL